MPAIIATVTNDGLIAITQRLAGITGSLGAIDSFKVGEGGWILTPSGQVPRVPDPTLTDLDCIVNPTRYGATSIANFQKALVLVDFTWTSPGTVEALCLLDFGDFNNDGFGNFPEIYEIGLFIGPIMVAYGTFPVEIKSPAVQIPNLVTVVMELG